MKASVIDLGYNSLKMVSYEIGPGNSFRAFDQRGSLTKIGEGLGETGFLNEERMAKVIRQLRLLNEINRLQKVDEVLPVATSPIREAINGEEFLRMARSEAGLRFRVLSSKEEALFAYLGAAMATRVPDALVFDLGGGSLELAFAKNFRVRRTMSLPLGALRLNDEFVKHEKKFEKKRYERMRGLIEDILPERDEFELDPRVVLIGVGGTVRALARHDQHLRDYPFNKLHNYVLNRKSVTGIHKRLRSMQAKEIARLPSFGKDRAESVTAGSLVVSLLMERLGFDRLVVSTHGLRDGILAEYLRRHAPRTAGGLTETAVSDSLSSWFGRRTWNDEFVRSLTSVGIFTPAERQILTEAASLIDIFLSTRSENLFYSILNEDSHLDHRDQLTLALAMVHAKAPKAANWFYTRYYSVLKDENKGSVDLLAAFVRLISVLRLTQSIVTARLRGHRLKLQIASPQREFPDLLLDQAIRDIEEATELHVVTVMTRKPAGAQVSEVFRQ